MIVPLRREGRQVSPNTYEKPTNSVQDKITLGGGIDHCGGMWVWDVFLATLFPCT